MSETDGGENHAEQRHSGGDGGDAHCEVASEMVCRAEHADEIWENLDLQTELSKDDEIFKPKSSDIKSIGLSA